MHILSAIIAAETHRWIDEYIPLSMLFSSDENPAVSAVKSKPHASSQLDAMREGSDLERTQPDLAHMIDYSEIDAAS